MTVQVIAKFVLLLLLKKVGSATAEREWYTPYQSEDPSPIIPPNRQKKEKGKKIEDYIRDRAA